MRECSPTSTNPTILSIPAACCAIALSAATASTAEANLVNLAQGREVTLASGSISGGAVSTMTDGAFLAAGTGWQAGTVWWTGTGAVFQIKFAGTVAVSGLLVQADNNDSYRVWYRDLASGNYLDLWTIGAVSGAGMRTRPNASNNGEVYNLGTSVFTDAIRIGAVGGDNMYSLSEVQAWGVVPSPGPIALLCLVGAAGMRRR
jgi:hypothetical protein